MGEVIKLGEGCLVCEERDDTSVPESSFTRIELTVLTIIINLVSGYPIERIYSNLCDYHRGVVDGFLAEKEGS
jgi:hypothetical protein